MEKQERIRSLRAEVSSLRCDPLGISRLEQLIRTEYNRAVLDNSAYAHQLRQTIDRELRQLLTLKDRRQSRTAPFEKAKAAFIADLANG